MNIREIAKILLIESLDMDYADCLETLKDCLNEMEKTLEAIKGTELYNVLSLICETKKDNTLNCDFAKHIMQEIGEE